MQGENGGRVMVGIGSVVYCAAEYVKHTSVDWKGLKLAESILRAYPNSPLYCGRLQSPMPALSAPVVGWFVIITLWSKTARFNSWLDSRRFQRQLYPFPSISLRVNSQAQCKLIADRKGTEDKRQESGDRRKKLI